MFGEPCSLPQGANVLPLLWTYIYKHGTDPKARCVCNGSPARKGTVIMGETYANALEHTGLRLFIAIMTSKNYLIFSFDVTNAFAEAPAPKAQLYVYIDMQYRDWYHKKFGKTIPKECNVLPVYKALQGHPESSRAWGKLITSILAKYDITPCTHEPCMYKGTLDNNTIYLLRQTDDFLVASSSEETSKKLITLVRSHLSMEVHDLGLVTWYSGVDIEQTRYYNKVSCKTYINKITTSNSWMDHNKHHNIYPIPIQGEQAFSRKLEAALTPATPEEADHLASKNGFKYRKAIGELIFVYVTSRPDIGYPIIELSQYSTNPGQIHYDAVKELYYYLAATIDEGIYYWRDQPIDSLPEKPPPHTKPDQHIPGYQLNIDDINLLVAAADATWAAHSANRKSVTAVILMICGGVIYYKVAFQKTIALSSTEAEFIAACEAGKAILFIRSVLEEMGIPQQAATIIYEDNAGALYMANAQQPTKRTRHMDIKTFALQSWVEEDLILLKTINTADQYADSLTKNNGRTLFYRHFDYVMGRKPPNYFMKQFHTYISAFSTSARSVGGCETYSTRTDHALQAGDPTKTDEHNERLDSSLTIT